MSGQLEFDFLGANLSASRSVLSFAFTEAQRRERKLELESREEEKCKMIGDELREMLEEQNRFLYENRRGRHHKRGA